jgi:hypothetical protein
MLGPHDAHSAIARRLPGRDGRRCLPFPAPQQRHDGRSTISEVRMNVRTALSAPAFMLIIVILVRVSGNDKAPALLVLPILFSLILFLVNIITLALNRQADQQKKLGICYCMLISLTPVMYVLLIILLSHLGIHATTFLGF